MAKVKLKSVIRVRVVAGCIFFFGLIAFFGSLFLWGDGFLLRFAKGVDYRIPLTDFLVNAPASFIAAVGLWRIKRYGYIASQFIAGFYTYAAVEILVEIFQDKRPYSVPIIVVQILALSVATILVLYLWRFRELFDTKK